MKIKSILFLTLFFLLLGHLYSQIPPNYYSSAIGLRGDTLKDSLNNIIDGHIEFPYTSSNTDCWDVLKQADKDPNNSNNVIGVYSRFSMNGPLEYNNAQGWSREHVWAKSRGNFGTSRGEGTDLHNLFAADISTNSARNNRNFDIGNTRYIDNGGTYNGTTDAYTSSTQWIWEPPDSLKGDIARVIFYMDVRYEGENGELDLEVADTLLSNTDQSPIHGNARTLYQWHLIDTVSMAERRRNDTIFKFQQNRNPFVDHPEFVEYIYRSRFGTSTKLNEVDDSESINIYPNPSNSFFTIKSNERIREIQMIDVNGRVVLNKRVDSNSVEIDISSFEKGVYTIQSFLTNGKVVGRKYLIE